jgi:hypothetical protein
MNGVKTSQRENILTIVGGDFQVVQMQPQNFVP